MGRGRAGRRGRGRGIGEGGRGGSYTYLSPTCKLPHVSILIIYPIVVLS